MQLELPRVSSLYQEHLLRLSCPSGRWEEAGQTMIVVEHDPELFAGISPAPFYNAVAIRICILDPDARAPNARFRRTRTKKILNSYPNCSGVGSVMWSIHRSLPIEVVRD